jgi:hypothetical protein
LKGKNPHLRPNCWFFHQNHQFFNFLRTHNQFFLNYENIKESNLEVPTFWKIAIRSSLILKFLKLGTRGSLIKEPTSTGYNHCGGDSLNFLIIVNSGYFEILESKNCWF